MIYLPLPAALKPGDKITCPAHYETPAVYKIFKVDGDRVYLMNEAGVALHGNFTVQVLRDFDYQLIKEGNQPCPKK